MAVSAIVVFDVGKTNVKLCVTDMHGRVLKTISAPNPRLPGPPYGHHDLGPIEEWLADGLATLAREHEVAAIVPAGHGSGGVLVDDAGPVTPMIDYETTPPAEIDEAYRGMAGSFRDRGSAIMLGAAHLARQMLWLERAHPEAFARARYYLPLPQYWAWRLSGVAATEVTSLAAQSHLWSPVDNRFAAIVERQGWGRLMPPVRPAHEVLGPLRPEWAARTGLDPATPVYCGIHDSSANLYRYQAAGLSDMTVVSTGTWLVALNDRPDPARIADRSGLSWNADTEGRPLAGVLMMAGREFSAVAGTAEPAPVTVEAIARLVAAGTMALPSFGGDDGFFPGSARRGRFVGPEPADADRWALAALYTALLTDAALDELPPAGRVILDGSFVREPLFARLVAALRDEPILASDEHHGVAAGAALLFGHATRTAPVPVAPAAAEAVAIPGFRDYRAAWRGLAMKQGKQEA